MKRLAVLALQLVVLDGCLVGDHHLGDGVALEAATAEAAIALKDGDRCALFRSDDVAGDAADRLTGAVEMQDVNWPRHGDAFRHTQDHTAGHQSRV